MSEILESGRVYLRKFSADDWSDLYEYLSDESVVKYEPYGVFTAEECRREAARRSGDMAFWAVCLKDSGKVIGNVYFQKQMPEEFHTWEIGFVFGSKYQGKGYAHEACLRLFKYAFEDLCVHRIIGLCNPENTSSWRLMERLNMRREGYHRKPAFFVKTENGIPVWHDSYEYSILDEEWFAEQV